MAPSWPKMTQVRPKMAQDDPKMAQDGRKRGPKRGPRGVPEGSQIGLPRFSNIEAEKGRPPINLKCPFLQFRVGGVAFFR